MRTWDNYKEHVRETDPVIARDIDEIESLAKIVSVMIDKRNAMGISQRELAKMCGIPQSSVARIEAHRTTPNLDTLLKILRQLNLEISIVPASK
jgi:DNA-binding XRE family transcriptional regulator